MLIKNYNYNSNEVSSIAIDTYLSQYLWIAFLKNVSGNCVLKKASAHNPLQIYFTVDISTDKIVKIVPYGSKLYMILEDSSLLGKIYQSANPIASPTDISIPAGITEYPIDILLDTNIYILIPGNTTGTNAKILEFSSTGTHTDTIDLTTINNAKSFTKSGDDFWIITYKEVGELVRVYPSGGGSYSYSVTI